MLPAIHCLAAAAAAVLLHVTIKLPPFPLTIPSPQEWVTYPPVPIFQTPNSLRPCFSLTPDFLIPNS